MLSAQEPEDPDISVDIRRGLNNWSLVSDKEPLPSSLSVTLVPPQEEPLSDEDLLRSFARRIRVAKFLAPDEVEDRLMTAAKLKATADGFCKRDSENRLRTYLLAEKLGDWSKKDKARLVRLLKDGGFLREGRSGSNTNTIAKRVGGKDVNCYPIRKSKILELVSPSLSFA